MRNYIAVCSLVFLCFLPCWALAEEAQQGDNASVGMHEMSKGILSQKEHQRISDFVEMVGYPRIHSIKERKRLENSAPYERVFSLGSKTASGTASLTYDTEGCRIVGFRRERPKLYKQGTEQLPKVYNEEQAFRLAQGLLSHHNFPKTIGSYRIAEYVSSSFGFETREWFIWKDFSFEGVPCRRRFFNCSICSHTGTILSALYKKVILPVKYESVLTKEQARDAAIDYLKRSLPLGYRVKKLEVLPSSEVRKVIATPCVYTYSYDEGEDAPDTNCAHYCWEVLVAAVGQMDEALPHVIWVRMDTGKVIGSTYDRWNKREETN
jgi:hypothetical protein